MSVGSDILRETIIELERTKKQEQILRNQSDYLIKAIEVLTSTLDVESVLEKIFDILHSAVKYQAALLLEEQGDFFRVSKSSCDKFVEAKIAMTKNFEKCLRMKPILIHDLSMVEDFTGVSEMTSNYRSALYLPIIGSSKRYIFVFFHPEKAWFTKSSLQLASRLAPIASQSFEIVNAHNDLHLEVEERKKVEKENKKLNSKLLETAYREGFAEHAVSILHNIGNLVTPFKTKVDQIRRSDFVKSADILDRVIKAYEEKKIPLEKFMDSIKKFGIELHSINEDVVERLSDFDQRVDRIAETITSQKKYANLKNKTKSVVKIGEIVEDIRQTFKNEHEKFLINFDTKIDPDCEIIIEKVAFNHCLTNVMTNAIESIQESSSFHQTGKYSGKITWKIYRHKELSDTLIFELADNGIGFREENKRSLFNFGYTTKKTGSGFGLHNIANFIKSNDGEISIQSAGEAQGATLVFKLPLIKGDDHAEG